MSTSVGLDIGRSSPKIVIAQTVDGGIVSRQELLFPTAVCPAIPLSTDTAMQRAAVDTVTYEGTQWFVGDTAILQGHDGMGSGLRDDWVRTTEHAVLAVAAIEKAQRLMASDIKSGCIITGLPSKLYRSQRDVLKAEMKRLFPNATIRVLPQPLGVWNTLVFDANGHQQAGFDADSNNYGVVEIGQYTTDFALIKRGVDIEHGYDSVAGMTAAAEELARLLADYQVDLPRATALLEKRTLKHFGREIDVSNEVREAATALTRLIHQKAQQIFGRDLGDLDGIAIAGGGAPLIGPLLQELSGWEHIRIQQKPRMAVAEGLCRLGLAITRAGLPKRPSATAVA
ncbi:hypothetical protein WT83_19290 [Burkholderia territorii]|uniref:Uncharacterized protein n=1 Tax=Burkholderia territorii TaxID=1503055 RepID=A0A108EI44_9BURK|nr:ParM/StbA family protein [Burkholderia territorii]KWN11738.1 hypothetical protein WT83_19290 [Burkholderia territorii]